MIQLTDTIFTVKTPIDAERIRIETHENNEVVVYGFPNPGSWEVFSKLPVGRFKILGTVTQTEIDFDVKPILAHMIVTAGGLGKCYQINVDGFIDYTYSDRRALRSLLTSKGITTYEKLVIVERK